MVAFLLTITPISRPITRTTSPRTLTSPTAAAFVRLPLLNGRALAILYLERYIQSAGKIRPPRDEKSKREDTSADDGSRDNDNSGDDIIQNEKIRVQDVHDMYAQMLIEGIPLDRSVNLIKIYV